MKKLQASVDSMTAFSDSVGRSYYREVNNIGTYRLTPSLTKQDTVKMLAENHRGYNVDSLFQSSTLMQKQRIISSASSTVGNLANDWNFKSFNIKQNDQDIRKHQTEWHNKITLSLACLIFFFIGAPLGGIIRKGGLGMPVIASVLIFIIYYIINNTGYKMARDGNWVVWMGMWTSTAVLAPLGAFLTYKSNNDSVVLNADAYVDWFKKVAGIRSVRHMFRKEVIIVDPDYERIVGDLEKLSADCQAYAQKKKLTKAPNYFTLWMVNKNDHEIEQLNDRMEAHTLCLQSASSVCTRSSSTLS
jgi:lipopolysaccharide export system permease protein